VSDPFWLSFALAYAGFTAVCLAMDRHARHVSRRPPARRTATLLRAGGYGLLALAAVPCVRALEGSTGLVMWLGVLSAAALSLIFLLPYAPRLAAALAVVAPLVALAFR
jgi:uncharacterized protein DUF3325